MAKYDEDLRCWKFLETARITNQVRASILTSTSNRCSLPLVHEAILTLFPHKKFENMGATVHTNPQTAATAESGGARRLPFRRHQAAAPARAVRVTELGEIPEEEEAGDAQDVYIAQCVELYDTAMEVMAVCATDEAQETLATVTAKKLSNQTLGRKFTSKPKELGAAGKSARPSVEELMKVHPCAICQQFGHWHRTCPQNPDRDASLPPAGGISRSSARSALGSARVTQTKTRTKSAAYEANVTALARLSELDAI